LWQQRCEDYFSLYGTHRSMWITIATMQFEGAAARWLQSVQRKIPHTTWDEFCGWIVTRFGRNQHQALLRQLYHIHQNDTVVDYVDRFASLIDQLSAYEPNIDNLHYTTRFLDGLRPHIRATITLQCPGDLDTAYSLALLQEEVGETRSATFPHRQYQLPAAPPMLALPAPRRLLQLPAPPTPAPASDNRPTVQAGSSVSVPVQTSADKWAALRQYRKARGLCFTCGEKWARDHQSKSTVQLHVIQEVLDMFQPDAAEMEPDPASDTQVSSI
jgi:hypothetical protein